MIYWAQFPFGDIGPFDSEDELHRFATEMNHTEYEVKMESYRTKVLRDQVNVLGRDSDQAHSEFLSAHAEYMELRPWQFLKKWRLSKEVGKLYARWQAYYLLWKERDWELEREIYNSLSVQQTHSSAKAEDTVPWNQLPLWEGPP